MYNFLFTRLHLSSQLLYFVLQYIRGGSMKKATKERRVETISARLTGSEWSKVSEVMLTNKIEDNSAFLRKAIACYIAQLEQKPANPRIQLRLYRYNQLWGKEAEQTPVRTFTFSGQEILHYDNYFGLDFSERQAQLFCEEFGAESIWVEACNVFHVLNAYYSSTHGRYIIHEKMELWLTDNAFEQISNQDEFSSYSLRPCRFILERCKFVSNYKEVIDNFSTYSHRQNLEDLSYCMADDIGEDYSVLDQLFEPYH